MTKFEFSHGFTISLGHPDVLNVACEATRIARTRKNISASGAIVSEAARRVNELYRDAFYQATLAGDGGLERVNTDGFWLGMWPDNKDEDTGTLLKAQTQMERLVEKWLSGHGA